LVSAHDDAIRQELSHVQEKFATIISNDVMHASGLFHCRVTPPNRDIDIILEMHGDVRPFLPEKGEPVIFPGQSQKS